MPERDATGLSPLDADRAHSMEHEGGVSAARVESPESDRPWKAAAAGVACLVGLAAGVGLVKLWRFALNRGTA
jgi:hypothetical protein